MTCTTIAGSSNYTISGYTPSAADIGKHLIIGMSYGINGSVSYTGAGGSSSTAVGLPLRVLVSAVGGQTISGATFSGGSTSAAAVNSVTNAECDLETDNGPTMQTAVDALATGGTLCVPPGSYGFDTGVEITNNATIYCEPGAVFYDARNDRYQNNPFTEHLFDFFNDTAGGVNGCTYVGTNTGVSWTMPGDIAYLEPDSNQPYYLESSSGLTFQNLTDLNNWADSDVTLTLPTDSSPGSVNNTVTNVYSQGGWAYGPALIAGSGNTFSNLIGRNICTDVEPNTSYEAGLTHNNTFDNLICIFDGTYVSTNATASFGADPAYYGFGQCSGTCSTTETVKNSQFIGKVQILPGCSGGSITDPWTNNTKTSNSTGSPICGCNSSC